LDEKNKTCQDLIRKDQEEQLEAILARHRKEISEHRAATDQILRQAEEKALKAKDDLLIREKEAEAELELMFNERKSQLEKKSRKEEEEVKELLFFQVDKQATNSLAALFCSSPSQPETNASLNPPGFGAITPLTGTPTDAARGVSQSAGAGRKTQNINVGGSPSSTPQVHQPRASSKTTASTTGEALNTASKADLIITLPYKPPTRVQATTPIGNDGQNESNGTHISVPRTPNKEPVQASLRTPLPSTKPASNALSNSSRSTSRKEPAQATSKAQTSSASDAKKSSPLQYEVPVTPSNGSARVPSRTSAMFTPTPASQNPQSVLWKTSPAGSLDSPNRVQTALLLTNSVSSNGCSQEVTRLSAVNLASNTPTQPLPTSQQSTTIEYEQGISSASKLPTTPRHAVYEVDSSLPPSLGEKRKKTSSPKRSSQTIRPDPYDEYGADSDVEPLSGKSRSNKRLKGSTSIPKFSSPFSEGNKVGSQVKSDVKAPSSRTGQRPLVEKASVGPRKTLSQGMAGQERHTGMRDVPRERIPSASPTPSRKVAGTRPEPDRARVTRPSSIFHGQVNQNRSTPTKPVTPSNATPSRAAPPHQSEQKSNKECYDLDRVCYPGKDGKMFSWLKKEDRGTEYQLRFDQNNMFTAYVNGRLGGSQEHGEWLINPNSVDRLEYSSEHRLVKVTRMWNNDPAAYIFFGFIHGAGAFVQRVLELRTSEPHITVKLES